MSDRTFVIHWLPARDKIVIVGINSLTILLFIYTNVMKLKNLLVWTQISGTIGISYQNENMNIFFRLKVEPTTNVSSHILVPRPGYDGLKLNLGTGSNWKIPWFWIFYLSREVIRMSVTLVFPLHHEDPRVKASMKRR